MKVTKESLRIKVDNLMDYVKEIVSINLEAPWGRSFEKNILLFRGQSNCNYELLPSIGRNRRAPTDVSIFNEERNLIEMAKYKMPDIFSRDLTPLAMLALLQHYGIPTRLLDLTENPLVALYFACCSNENEDGEVICFKYDETNVANYPIIDGIAESYKFAQEEPFTLIIDFYNNIINQPYFIEHKFTVKLLYTTDKQRIEWVKNCCSMPLFTYAPIKSIRQQIQAGRYLLFSNRITNSPYVTSEVFDKIIDPIPKNHERITKRIIVPRKNKTIILEQLRLMGITKATLFCDNIDTVCESVVDICKKRLQRN